MQDRDGNALLERLVKEFEDQVGLPLTLSPEFHEAARSLAAYLSHRKLNAREVRTARFVASVNRKFKLNSARIRPLYAHAAKNGYVFNHHQKARIEEAYAARDRSLLLSVCEAAIQDPALRQELIGIFDPIDPSVTTAALRRECSEPAYLRRPRGDRNISGQILEAQFAAYLFGSLPAREMHEYFDPEFDAGRYEPDFFHELQRRSPHLFGRDRSLAVLALDVPGAGYDECRAAVCGWLTEQFDQLTNYGHLAVLLRPTSREDGGRQWQLAADVMLFAEKHLERPLNKAYFRGAAIAAETLSYVPGLDPRSARFDLVNEGFTYKDCFVLAPEGDAPLQLLLLFQKNDRDETKIPCPACRSDDVRGNSYPTLGVRSWECNNRLCPERSKYNRGKRYSLKALIMQAAIEEEDNAIPRASIRRWARDVQYGHSIADALDMLIRHYSLVGDTVHLYGLEPPLDSHGRIVKVHDRPLSPGAAPPFFDSASWFKRYIVTEARAPEPEDPAATVLGDGGFVVYCGDALKVLPTLGSESMDGAVTSPPYFNAREYAQWPNIYCYLHDMHVAAREVFRLLKPGSLYLFNIFDYFDNERSVSFSAMGDKRLILSAYMVDIFRRVGFEVTGNVVWDKGAIEGKRAFNGGNESPYYQAPFNCWEHVLVLRKPGPGTAPVLPAIIQQKPVFKFVRGENRHGHTAPFPPAIPELLVSLLPPGAVVLDPFAGSLTTGRVAERREVRSVQVERDLTYCELGLAMRERERASGQESVLQLAPGGQ